MTHSSFNKKRGVPSKLTPEMEAKILEILRAGHFRETCCAAVGIHIDTFYGWLERARKGDEPYATFAGKVAIAEAEAEIAHTETLMSAGPQDWRAAAHYLRYRWASRWADKSEVKVSGEVNVKQDGVLDALAKIAAKAKKKSDDEGSE